MRKLKRKYRVRVNQTLLAAGLAITTFVVINNTPFSFAYKEEDFSNSSQLNFQESVISTELVNSMEVEARKHLDSPYILGGITPEGFDSSSFIQSIFAKNGINIPRTAMQQFEVGNSVNMKDLSKGDLVFFTISNPSNLHVGMYLGDDQFINVNNKGIMIDSLDDEYWTKKYLGAKRMFVETNTGIFYADGVFINDVLPSE